MTTATVEAELLFLQKRMFNFAYSLTANKFDAEDLLQDTSLKVLDNHDKFVDDLNFRGWVLTIMKNIFINNYRKNSRTQSVIDGTIDLFSYEKSTQESTFDTEGYMLMKDISCQIDGLSCECRIPFKMHIAGFKYEEISQTLNLPIGTVKSRIFSARKSLRLQFADYR